MFDGCPHSDSRLEEKTQCVWSGVLKSFHWLAGYSLVPLADIFNHKAAFVKLTDEYAVAGDAASSGSEDSGSEEEGSDPDNDGKHSSEGDCLSHSSWGTTCCQLLLDQLMPGNFVL